jgi:hypothetical protein
MYLCQYERRVYICFQNESSPGENEDDHLEELEQR